MLAAQRGDLRKVVCRGHDNTGLTLDWFQDDGGDVLTLGGLQNRDEVLCVAVSDLVGGVTTGNVGHEGPEVQLGVFVVGTQTDGTESSAVEVTLCTKDDGLVLRNVLFHVPPSSGELQRGLDGLCTGVHGQNGFEAEKLGDELGEFCVHVIVERSGGQSQSLRLLGQGLDDVRMAVTLVDGGVGTEEVQVLLTLWVPHVRTLGLVKDHGQRVVVVGGVLVFPFDGLLGGEGGVRHCGVVCCCGGREGVEGRDSWKTNSSVGRGPLLYMLASQRVSR